MARIFFKKEGQKPSLFASLGLITACLAGLALVTAGPLFRVGLFGDPSVTPSLFDLQFKIIWVSFRLVIVAAGFTLVGILHGRFSSRARASWRALVAAILTAAIGWPIGQLIYKVQYTPVLHDISTRPETLLRFEALPERRYDTATPADTLGGRLDADYLSKLRTAYPGLGSIPFAGSVSDATKAALEQIEALGWQVVKSDPSKGRVEAIYTSPWFGFRTFILVDVRAIDAVAFLDIRAVSEMGHTDMGTGARLIGALQTGIGLRG